MGSVPSSKSLLVANTFASLLQNPGEDGSRLTVPSPSASSEAASPPSEASTWTWLTPKASCKAASKAVARSGSPLTPLRELSAITEKTLSCLDVSFCDRSMLTVLCFLGVHKQTSYLFVVLPAFQLELGTFISNFSILFRRGLQMKNHLLTCLASLWSSFF